MNSDLSEFMLRLMPHATCWNLFSRDSVCPGVFARSCFVCICHSF